MQPGYKVSAEFWSAVPCSPWGERQETNEAWERSECWF